MKSKKNKKNKVESISNIEIEANNVAMENYEVEKQPHNDYNQDSIKKNNLY